MRSLIRLVIVSLIATLFLLNESANATSCSENSICKWYPAAAIVFLGTAVTENTEPDGSVRTRFSVQEAFKGTSETEVLVVSEKDFMGLGFMHFRIGDKYLVVAGRSEDGKFTIGSCNPSMPSNLAVAELNFLRKLAGKKLQNSILFGIAARLDMEDEGGFKNLDPLTGAKIKIVGSAGHSIILETVVDQNGYFEFENISAGTYQVTAELPKTLQPISVQINLEANACASTKLITSWNGHIAGKALKSDNVPIKEAHLSLIRDITMRGQAIGGYTDENGKYIFEPIQPGRYIVGLLDTPVETPSDEYPFPPLFYPNATAVERATWIDIAPGQKLDNIDFHVPDFEPRSIRVEILWVDKKPAQHAQVFIEYEQSYCWKRTCVTNYYTADELGHAMFNAYGDGKIRVYALLKKESSVEWISEAKELNLNDLPHHITLILTTPNKNNTSRETPITLPK